MRKLCWWEAKFHHAGNHVPFAAKSVERSLFDIPKASQLHKAFPCRLSPGARRRRRARDQKTQPVLYPLSEDLRLSAIIRGQCLASPRFNGACETAAINSEFRIPN